MYTIPQIISIAKASQWMANQAAANGALYGSPVDPMLGVKLYVIRRDIELVYNLNPTYAGLQETSIYLLGLCNIAAAAFIVSGGGTVTPSQPNQFVYLIPITGADFYDATNYVDPRIVGESLQIFWNDVNRYLNTDEFESTAAGINILISGFDAILNPNYSLKIYIVNP
jgi:hypothetical protein